MNQTKTTSRPRMFTRMNNGALIGASPGLLLSLQILTTLLLPVELRSQEVQAGIEPWRLIRIFIEQTGSTLRTIDREAFAVRLGGRLAGLDPTSIGGRWEKYSDVKIDTVVWLDPLYRSIPPDPEAKMPGRVDTIDRTAIWATVWNGGNYDNSYFFLERDSIWRIVEWLDFPGPTERNAIAEAAGSLDSTTPDYIVRGRNLLNLLHPDQLQIERFRDLQSDLDPTARQLAGVSAWRMVQLGSVDADSLDPYGALDLPDNSPETFLYRLNPAALDRLFIGGIARIVHIGRSVRFEIERFGGRSAGFLYAPPGASTPAVERDGDFMLRPVGDRWWYYKSFFTPDLAGEGSYHLSEVLHPPEVEADGDAAPEKGPDPGAESQNE